jgi:Glycosyl transferases group 1
VSVAKLVRPIIKRTILASQSPAADAAWRVSADQLQGLEIHWPTTLEWAATWGWVEPLFRGFRMRTKVIRRDVPQRLAGTVVIEVWRGGRSYRVALNISDYPELVHYGTSQGVREGVALEFKMQYLKGGYGLPNVIPGGFVSASMLVDWLARGPRRTRDHRQFLCDVYGRFGLNFATETRTAAIRALSTQSRFKFFGGGNKVAYREFLHEVARARVCLDLPGNGPFCFRLVDYLAVGACIVSPPHAVEMPEPLVDRKHIVYTRPDMSDLVDLCERYVNDEPAREAIAQEARGYFRRHLYWRSLADYYLRMMLEKLPA